MNAYEALLDEACDTGLTVKEKPLKYNNGRIKGNRIAIRQDIDTEKEKACVLAEELGHYYTSVGNILDMTVPENRKQERQARLWGYNRSIGLFGLIRAYEHDCKSRYEECIECYRDKYGIYKEIDNYVIYFIPHLTIFKKI